MKRGAILLAFLLLVPLLPLAEAAGPEQRPWAPYNAGEPLAAIAMAREGTTIAASLRTTTTQPPAPGAIPGAPSIEPRTDVAVLDHEYGFARSFNVQRLAPDGRTHVAVSADGSGIVSLRRELIVNPATGADQAHTQVHYARVGSSGNWTSSPSYERAIALGTTEAVKAVGVAISDSGHRIAVLTQEGANYVLRGYSASASSLDSAFEIRQPGTPRALSANGDLSRLLVAGQFPSGNFTYGGAYVLHFAQAEPLATWLDTAANNTDVRGGVFSRDGSTVALGGGDGRILVFRNARDALTSPGSLLLGGGGIANLSISEDGARVATALGTTVTMLDASGSAPAVIWNATVSGQEITGLALNRTGGLLVVGSGGTGGAVHGFSDMDNTVLWSIPGDTRGVALDSAGTRVAYAQRAAVGAARLPRALVMDLQAGGKVAPTQVVTVPGTASVGVSLRNEGAALERVIFEETSPDVSVVTEPAIVSVRPGAVVRLNLTIQVEPGLVGQRVFNVSARSLTSGAIDNVTLSVVPKPTLDVKLQVNATDILAEPGKPSEILLTVVNNGTGDAPVVIRASQVVSAGELWELSLSETQLTALRGTRTSVRATVTPPATAQNGTASLLTFTLEGQDVFDQKRVSLRINPELKVEVNATGVTKFIEPGRKAFYNVTVTNIGSLPRDFDVFFRITSSDNRNWGVDMPSQVVRLDPLRSKTLPVSIVAPADALPQERVAVRISARSIPELENESVVEDNVTLYGIAVEMKLTTTTTPTGIPYLTPLAIVATVALIALLVPRRRDP